MSGIGCCAVPDVYRVRDTIYLGLGCGAVPGVYRVRDTIYLGLAVVLFLVYTEYVTQYVWD